VISLLQQLIALANRRPWLLPAISFAGGWVGFVLVRRGEELARIVALLALCGWLWLLVEPWVRRRLERRRPRVGNFVVNFISQSLQQELLFFSLPLLIGATQLDAGQLTFTGMVAAAALLSTVDPLYERLVAARAARRMTFHAFCSWIAALVVLPMVLLVPVERALPISLGAVGAWLLLTLPMSLYSLPRWRSRAAWLAGMVVVPLAFWELRDQIPAAGLAVTDARVTRTIDVLTPGAPIQRIRQAELAQGVIAFAAIRAPAGLSQQVAFEWRHNDEREWIPIEIEGGRAEGFRAYSRKQTFPADSVGQWVVDVLTPQGQLLKRLRFVVEADDSPRNVLVTPALRDIPSP
jgi:hypothetical protein